VVFLLSSLPILAQNRGIQQPPFAPPARPGLLTQPEPGTTSQIQNKVDDQQFVRDAAIAGLVDDHTKGNQALSELATAQSWKVPESLDAKHRSRVDKLAKLSGPQFDRAYLKDALKDQDVGAFQDEARYSGTTAVKDFAAKTLPTM
jgi:Domain of unknown function (DUF4142)